MLGKIELIREEDIKSYTHDMGEDDFVSHAASLRLSQLRLQIEPLEHEGDSSQHHQADPVSIEPQLSTEDWELLSSYIPETSGLQDRPFHQTLYRILCKHEPTAVYFDHSEFWTFFLGCGALCLSVVLPATIVESFETDLLDSTIEVHIHAVGSFSLPIIHEARNQV